MSTQPIPRLTEQDYLTAERTAIHKSEFVGGAIYAMSGGTSRHSNLASRLIFQLSMYLEGSSCRVFTSDLRIRVPQGDYFYPDASVVCGPVETTDDRKDVCTNPILLVEVLSPSTADYDRGLKFEHYRQISSLMEYLIIHSDGLHIEHYSRQHDASWVLREYRGQDDKIPLPAVKCELLLGSVYAGVMELAG